MKTVPHVALIAILVLVVSAPASAHTELSATTPLADSVVSDPPSEVVLEFSEVLRANPEPAVRVVDPLGDDLVSAPPVLDGSTVTVPLNLAVSPGEHQVDWVVTAADGDEQQGSFTFTFDLTPVPAGTPEPEFATPPAPAETQTAEPTEALPSVEPTSQSSPSPQPSPTETTSDDAGGTGLGGLAILAAVLAAAGGALVYSRRRGINPDDF